MQKEYEELFKTITASSESIKISVPKDVGEWGQICSQIHDIYFKDECEENFPEVFHIRPVEDKGAEDKLFERLLEEINQQNGDVYLELPDLIDFQEATNFSISVKDRRKKHSFSCEELDIKRFYEVVRQLGREVELEDLRKWELILLGPNGEKRKKFRLLKCLIFEYRTGEGREYHFSHGRWYGINQKFSQQLKKIDDFRTGKINDSELLNYRHKNENEYNQELSKILGGTCLDGKLIPMQGYDKVELCDVLLVESHAESKRKNIFIHVKRKHGGSSGLSHLFQQGSVSLILLKSGDKVFLKGVKERNSDFDENLSAVVHYLIVGNRPNESIPLFARISLFKTIKDIKSRGSDICWSVVDPA